MAEPRRMQLTTLSSAVSPFRENLAPTPKDSCGVNEKQPGDSRLTETSSVRLVLKLFESDEQNFPEFNYNQLVDKKVSQRDVQLSRHEQEDEQENDQLFKVARSLEKKYGGSKKDRIQDLIDIGYGYDDEDSFIDNSEPYDEFVPASITTKYGGFYVNSGVLQFRQASGRETENIPIKEETSEIRKKRKGNGKQKELKKLHLNASGERGINWDTKLCTLSATDKRLKKKKKAVQTLSVTRMLKKFRREKEEEKMENATEIAAPPLFPADAAGGGSAGLADPLLNLIGSTADHALIQAASTVDFDIDLDSLLDVAEEPLSPQPQTPTELIQSKKADQSQFNIWLETEATAFENTKSNPLAKLESEHVEFESSFTSSQCEPLPEGLPPEMEDNIRKLMMAAKTSEGESKLKFFNPDINSILVAIDLQCRELGGQIRSKVYRHLSSFMPCSKDALLKRVRRLSITHLEEPHVAENPLQKLKEAIERSMPEQIASFYESCQVYEQIKTSKAAEEENLEGKSGKKGPKKLFKWNQEIKECLLRVLREKTENCDKGQEMEEYVKILLKRDIKHLWPKGWMQSRVLIRESKKLLGFTALSGNKAKCLKETSVCITSKLSDSCKTLTAPSGVLQTADVDLEATEKPSCEQQKDAAALRNVEVEPGASFPSHIDKNTFPLIPTPALSYSTFPEAALPGKEPLFNKSFAAAVPGNRLFSGDFSSSCCQPSHLHVQQSRPVVWHGPLQTKDASGGSSDPVLIDSDDDDDVIIL